MYLLNNKEMFTHFYMSAKYDGEQDSKIMKELNINQETLRVLKQIHNVPKIVIRKNKYGVSECDFRKAERIGLERRLVLKRVRDCGWSIEKAIREPKTIRRRGNNENG